MHNNKDHASKQARPKYFTQKYSFPDGLVGGGEMNGSTVRPYDVVVGCCCYLCISYSYSLFLSPHSLFLLPLFLPLFVHTFWPPKHHITNTELLSLSILSFDFSPMPHARRMKFCSLGEYRGHITPKRHEQQ